MRARERAAFRPDSRSIDRERVSRADETGMLAGDSGSRARARRRSGQTDTFLQRGLTGIPYVVPAMGSARMACCKALSAA